MEYVVGLFLPPFIDYFNRNVHNSVEKAWITVIVCFVVAALLDHALIMNGSFSDVKSVLILFAAITGEAMTVYEIWWQNSKPRVLLPGNGVEATTEIG